MKEKLIKAKNEFSRQIKNLSITFTLIIHLLYIGYLSYSLMNDVGNKYVNISLLVGTAVFLLVYLFLKITGQKQKGQIKSTKKNYKRFKLVTKVFTTATALYSMYTATSTANKLAMIFTTVGAVFLSLRILVEIIVILVKRGARKMKDNFIAKRESKKEEALSTSESKRLEKAMTRSSKKNKMKNAQPQPTEETTSDDVCAISEEELTEI